MVFPLPDALAKFSQASIKNIEALSSIQKAVPDVATTVRGNIKEVAAEAVTQPGDILETVPSFAQDSVGTFQNNITIPPPLNLTRQQEAFSGLFGTGATAGAAVDGFLSLDVKLEDVIPAQQLFKTIQSLGGNALYVDPLQAYSHVTSATANITNLCQEADSLIGQIQTDIAQLLSVQTVIDYVAIKGMDTAFFKSARSQLRKVTEKYDVVKESFEKNGRYDPIAKAELCILVDSLARYLLLDDPSPLQLDIIRKRINDNVQRLREILRTLPLIIADVSGFIPAYVASAVAGKLFNAVQGAVLDQTGVDLDRIARDIDALASLSADDRAKLLANWAIGGSLQAIRAYICQLDPSTEVVDLADPVIGPMKVGYDNMTTGFAANDLTPFIDSFEAEIDKFTSTMQTCVTRDAGAELTTSAGTVTGVITSMSAALVAICGFSQAFKVVFTDQLELVGGDRALGALELLGENGLGAARDVGMTESFDRVTDIPLSESTQPGELAQSIRQRISELPSGNEQDQLTLLYSEVYARHRATVLNMDFTSRESVETFLAPSEEEANRDLVNKTTKVYSKLPPSDFDQVLTR